MDNLIELVIPVLFILSFALQSFFKSNKDKKQQQERQSNGDEIEVPEHEKRQGPGADVFEEIRREIRRKIQENQTAPEQQKQETLRRMQAERTSQAKPAASIPASVGHSTAKAEPDPNEAGWKSSVDASNQRIKEMEDMKNRVSKLQRKAEAEKRKAGAIAEGKLTTIKPRRRRKKPIVGEVISELQSPYSARKAVLNREILGPPIGLRNN